jgi:ribonuclease Z
MTTAFLPRLVNGQVGDPVLFVDILRQKRALLFDCGTLQALSPPEVLRVTDVFVSHAHIDHFIGFDHLLRLHLGRGRRVRIYGPTGITACVRGKLAGYTWNLVQHQRLVFEVREYDGRHVQVTEFLCHRRFKPSESHKLPDANNIWHDELITVQATVLDHRTPCLAYAVVEHDFYNVDPVQLETLGLRPGPWLNQLKDGVRKGQLAGLTYEIEGNSFEAQKLAAKLLIITRGQRLAYVTDALGSPENLARIAQLANQADLLFCEGAFLYEDRERARETFHLTAQQAGEAARLASAKRLVIFHFSPKYEGRFSDLEREAENAFVGSP